MITGGGGALLDQAYPVAVRCGRIVMRTGPDTAQLCTRPLVDGQCPRHGAPLPAGEPDPLLTLPVGYFGELTEDDWGRVDEGRWPPVGYRYVWVDDLVADPDWRVATGEEYVHKGCRHILPGRGTRKAHACGAGPVAALMRTVHRRTGDVKAPWFYCRRHLFGHVWVDPVGDSPPRLLGMHLVEGEVPVQGRVKAARAPRDVDDG